MEDTEVGIAMFVREPIFGDYTQRDSCVVVVSGPDEDGDICILAGAETYLPREVAFTLANEILRRLKASAGE